MKIYLDDVRTPLDGSWTIVRNYYQFIELISSINFNEIEVISFDHDLDDSAMLEYHKNTKYNNTINYQNIIEKTGLDCVKFLIDFVIENNYTLPTITIHSFNPIGSLNMKSYIESYLKSINQHKEIKRVNYEFYIE